MINATMPSVTQVTVLATCLRRLMELLVTMEALVRKQILAKMEFVLEITL